MFWRRRKSPHELERSGSSEDVFQGLRNQVLAAGPNEITLDGGDPDALLGGMMEVGTEKGIASFIALVDGTTSMYTSTGGGVIGGGFHQKVREANSEFLRVLAGLLSHLTHDDDPADLPPAGIVHFRALTSSQRLVARCDETSLRAKADPMWPAFYAGHRMIGALRESESASRGDPPDSRSHK